MHGAAGGAAASLERVDGGVGGRWGGETLREAKTIQWLCCAALCWPEKVVVTLTLPVF